MIGRIHTHIGSQQRIVTYRYLSAIEERTSEVNIDIIANRNIFAELASKVRLHPHTFPYFLEEFVHDFLTSFNFFIFSTVKLLKQLLCLNPQVKQISIKIIIDLMLLHFIPFCHIQLFKFGFIVTKLWSFGGQNGDKQRQKSAL